MSTHESDFEVTESQQNSIDYTVGEWLAQCEREAPLVHAAGRGGHFGTLTLRASVGDDGVSFTIERSFEESL